MSQPHAASTVIGPDLEAAVLAYLEACENGEEARLPEHLADNRLLQAYLAELRDDEQAVESLFAPLREAVSAAGPDRFFGNYELLKVIGKGGQGVVHQARQVHVNKEVALKLVDPDDRRRSLRELQMVADLEHQHIVRVYHVGEHDGQLYFTMKLAENGSLADDHNLNRLRLPLANVADLDERKVRLARFLAKIARAVAHIHEKKVIHRDLKLANILLDVNDEPLLTDFGLARRCVAGSAAETTVERPTGSDEKETVAGTVQGTWPYMAPEQMRGETNLTPAVDIYSLGVIFYKLLTNRLPFEGTREEIAAQVTDPERVPPAASVHNPLVGLGSDLDLMCSQCLDKDPARRYASAAELADDLERFSRGEPISLRRLGWWERARDWFLARVWRAGPTQLNLPEEWLVWGMIDLWDALLNFAFHGAVYVLIRFDQPPLLLWLALLLFLGAWWTMFLSYLRRRESLGQSERDLLSLWAGVFAGGVVLFGVCCPPFGSARAADLLAFYPPWTVINGLAFLVVGRIWWGRYYLVALAHFVTAALMPLWPSVSPLVYAVLNGVCMTWQGFEHQGRARERPAA
jgi:serine/threonine protein kinase